MKYWMMWICVAVLCMGAWAGDEYREFTNTEGKSFRGRVLSFNARKGIVQIEAVNKKRAKVPLTALSEKDQAYVRAWDNAQDFMNTGRFRISAKCNREENEAKSGQKGNKVFDVRNVDYEITLDNRSDTKLANIKVEYCIFYEQEDFKESAGEVVCEQGVCYKTMDIAGIPAQDDKVLKSDVVIVYKEEMDSNYYYYDGSGNVKHGEVHGLWLRASIALPSGERVYRDFCMPDSLPNSRTWASKSVDIGMN